MNSGNDRRMQCDAVSELADSYALGALDSDERDAVERHSATCARCRQVLDEAVAVAARLALAAPLHRAPPALHASLMAHLDDQDVETQQRTPLRSHFLGGTSAAVDPPVALRHGSRRARPSRGTLAASVAALLVLGAGAWTAALQMQVNHLQDKSQVLQRSMVEVEGQRRTMLLLTAKDSATSTMQPTKYAAGARGGVIWNADEKQCSVIAAGLPPAPSGSSYRLMFHSNSYGQWDGGQLTPGQGGTAQKTVDLSRLSALHSYEVMIVVQNGRGERQSLLWANVGSQ